jgi:hypothetical protein
MRPGDFCTLERDAAIRLEELGAASRPLYPAMETRRKPGPNDADRTTTVLGSKVNQKTPAKVKKERNLPSHNCDRHTALLPLPQD